MIASDSDVSCGRHDFLPTDMAVADQVVLKQ